MTLWNKSTGKIFPVTTEGERVSEAEEIFVGIDWIREGKRRDEPQRDAAERQAAKNPAAESYEEAEPEEEARVFQRFFWFVIAVIVLTWGGIGAAVFVLGRLAWRMWVK